MTHTGSVPRVCVCHPCPARPQSSARILAHGRSYCVAGVHCAWAAARRGAALGQLLPQAWTLCKSQHQIGHSEQHGKREERYWHYLIPYELTVLYSLATGLLAASSHWLHRGHMATSCQQLRPPVFNLTGPYRRSQPSNTTINTTDIIINAVTIVVILIFITTEIVIITSDIMLMLIIITTIIINYVLW